jgi:DNA-binding transcriptional MerR regulator
MKIGELARRTGLTIRTIRYYEELGLLEPLERSTGGFRLFSEGDVLRLELIHFLKGMGLPLGMINNLLASKNQGPTMGEVVKTVLPNLTSLAEEAQSKIEKYQKIKDDIERTKSILKKCVECVHAPDEVSCMNCEVIKSKSEHPLLVRLIY